MVVSTCQHTPWQVGISKAFYRVAAELGKAVQLCVFILGVQYLYFGVLKRVFEYGCAVNTLVIIIRSVILFPQAHGGDPVPPRGGEGRDPAPGVATAALRAVHRAP